MNRFLKGLLRQIDVSAILSLFLPSPIFLSPIHTFALLSLSPPHFLVPLPLSPLSSFPPYPLLYLYLSLLSFYLCSSHQAVINLYLRLSQVRGGLGDGGGSGEEEKGG